MGLILRQLGNFRHLETFLAKARQDDLYAELVKHGQAGVRALAAATPKDSGNTADRWVYKVRRSPGRSSIEWLNFNHTDDGTPIVILLQYGHATGTGGYVQGYDFINPAIQGTMDAIAEDVWKAVISA